MLILFVFHLFVSKHNYILQVYVLNAEYSFQETLGPSHHIMLSVLTSLTCPIMPLWPGSSDDIWSWSRPFWSVLKLTWLLDHVTKHWQVMITWPRLTSVAQSSQAALHMYLVNIFQDTLSCLQRWTLDFYYRSPYTVWWIQFHVTHRFHVYYSSHWAPNYIQCDLAEILTNGFQR